jgi:hypothetical protein
MSDAEGPTWFYWLTYEGTGNPRRPDYFGGVYSALQLAQAAVTDIHTHVAIARIYKIALDHPWSPELVWQERE